MLTPPLLFGLLFLANYLTFKFVYDLSAAPDVRIGESKEFNAVLVFAFLALHFVIKLKAAAKPIR